MSSDWPSLQILDAADDVARAEYERAFYAAFVRVTSNRLIRTLWAWDEARGRLATRVPYADQRIYIQRDADGAIASAIGVNVAMRQLQSSAFGFSLPTTDAQADTCEFVTFFAVDDDRALAPRLQLFEGVFRDLHAQGLRSAYASTARRPLPIYRRIGGSVVADTRVDGEDRFFLRFSLDRHWMRGRAHRDLKRLVGSPGSPTDAYWMKVTAPP